MSYTDLRDFVAEASFDVPKIMKGDRRLTIQIEKLGGGTLGKAYDGTWRYVVNYAGRKRVMYGQDLETATPYTHEQAAKLVAAFLAAYGAAGPEYDGDNAPTGAALKMCRDNHDRLALWADDSED